MADPTAGGGTEGLRDSLAIWLMACDECIGGDQPADYLDHERRFLAHGRDAEHSGDCTKESHACSRCICDMYLRNADALIAGPLADLLARASAEQARVEAENARLRGALHDAIRRPLGVTPDSGAEFYSQRMADEAEERRAAGTGICLRPIACDKAQTCVGGCGRFNTTGMRHAQ